MRVNFIRGKRKMTAEKMGMRKKTSIKNQPRREKMKERNKDSLIPR
jgi:hypothetical protein